MNDTDVLDAIRGSVHVLGIDLAKPNSDRTAVVFYAPNTGMVTPVQSRQRATKLKRKRRLLAA